MKIIVVDDDRLVTSSLKTILSADPEIEVLAAGNSADEAVALFKAWAPDILLMDIRMGERTGIDAAREIFSCDPAAKILFLTTFSDDEYIVEALKMGAKGYLLKQNFEAIVPALKAVAEGQTVFGTTIMAKLPQLLNPQSAAEDLEATDFSAREQEILQLVADGMNNKEIAETLFLSEGTVRNYVSLLLEKLALRDRTQLAIYYYKHQRRE